MKQLTITLALLSILAAPACAQTSYPMLMSLDPIAVQVGTTSEHSLHARYNLAGSYQMFFTGTGVAGTPKPPERKEGDKKPLTDLPLSLTVAPDALPGVRDFRVITPEGASTLGQLVVTRFPVVSEPKTPNDKPEQAQEITLPATVCGTIEKAEDVDYFKFKVEAGTSLTFHVWCNRLQNRIHDLQQHADPLLTVKNAAGVTVAEADNDFFADPCLRYTFAQGGEYQLVLRDVRYHGNVDWKYCVEISDGPFAVNLYPPVFNPGASAKVEVVGYQLPPDPVRELTIPAETAPGPMSVAVPMGDNKVTNPAPALATPAPVVLEQAGDNDAVAGAQTVAVPAGISGRIDHPGDIDCYAFEAKKGEVFCIEVFARRLQSSLDSTVRILNDKGAQLVENDDARIGRLTHADSKFEAWTAPADGRYFLEIRDLHSRGGPEFVYGLQVTRAEPHFELYADTDKTLLAPGLSGAIFVRAERKNGFAGEIQLAIEGLPPGVTATCGRILANGQDGCIILQAAADAPRGAANVRITGTATHPREGSEPLTLTATAVPLEELYFPGGGRGHWPVEMHTVSVGSGLDVLEVKLSTTAVTLKPGESQKIDITVVRAPEFKQNVTLDMLYRHLGGVFGDSLPKGVTIDEKSSNTLLTGGQTEGSIVLKAAADAPPVEAQQVSVMANVSINFVMKFTYSAAPLRVTVAAP